MGKCLRTYSAEGFNFHEREGIFYRHAGLCRPIGVVRRAFEDGVTGFTNVTRLQERMTGKANPVRGKPPEFIRKAFPRTSYHPRWRLLTWFPRGVLNEAFADQVIEFIETEKSIQEVPFDRYVGLSGLTHIRIGIDHIIHTARRRRRVKQPVKTALFADNPMSFGIAHSHELLMYDAMIEVRAFKERTTAAQWLEVPLKTPNCPS